MPANTEPRSKDCVLCGIVSGDSSRAPLAMEDAWSVTALPRLCGPGALAVVALRHVDGLGDMTSDELASLGPLLSRVTRALEESCAASKVYLFSFGENHPHFHVGMVVRPHDLEPDRRGPALVLSHLGQGPSPPELGRTAEAIRADVARWLASHV